MIPQKVLRTLPLLCFLGATACGSPSEPPSDGGTGTPDGGAAPIDAGPECSTHGECPEATPYCNPAGACAEPPPAGAIGWGDGSPQSVTLEKIFTSAAARQATDLEFNNTRPNELWVLHRWPASAAACTSLQQTRAGCTALEGSVTVIFDPATPDQRSEWKKDANAWHFMRRPPALAFGVDGFFATCGEARTGNFLDDPADFIGPTLWWSDFSLFGVDPPPEPTMNGTHFDMLHATPYCVGIAHEAANIYWVFNGDIGALDRYDFNEDHGPGADDHSDGEIHRYAPGTLRRVEGVPGHLVYNSDDHHVYVADTGNGRIVKLDAQSGVPDGEISPVYEPLQGTVAFADAVVTEVVAPGLLERPSGLELHGGLLYVTDNATSRIYAFDLEGNEVRRLDTGLPAGSLAGLTFSPDGVLYFVDLTSSDVYRILP
jgi:hypothetical protein